MTGGLQDMYRQRVLDHSRTPHNQRRPGDANREVTGFNPLCGDKLTIYLNVVDGIVSDAAFDGSGCAISVASASMMTDALQGLPAEAALELVAEVGRMFSSDSEPDNPRLDDVRALQGVRDYPSRVKCATLAWNTAEAALQNSTGQVTTE